MAINYRVTKCANPKYPDQENYLSCKNVKTGDYDFETLAEDIAESTTVTKADATAVLAAINAGHPRSARAGRDILLKYNI